jgi:lysophospholipase L1-like esterase
MQISRKITLFLLSMILLSTCGCSSSLAAQSKSKSHTNNSQKSNHKINVKQEKSKAINKTAEHHSSNDINLSAFNLKDIGELTGSPCPEGFSNKNGILVLGDSHAAAETFYSFYQKTPSLIWIPPDQRLGHTLFNGTITSKNLSITKTNCIESECALGGFESQAANPENVYVYKIKNLDENVNIQSCLLFKKENALLDGDLSEAPYSQKHLGYFESTNPLSLKVPINTTFYGGLIKTPIVGNPVTVIGMNGAKTEDLMNWIKSSGSVLEIIHPKYLILIIGTNEIYNRPYRQEIVTKQLEYIADEIRQKLPETKIVLVSPPPLYKDILIKTKSKNKKSIMSHHCKGLAADFEKIEANYIQLAADKNLIFFNWRLTSSDKCKDFEEGKLDNWRPDGVHLTPAGYKTLQKNLFEFLLKETQDEIFKN